MSPAIGPDQYELTTIARYADLVSAGLAKSHLEAAGVFAFIPDETIIGLHKHYAPAMTGVALQVCRRDAWQARDLLKAYATPPAAGSAGNERPPQPDQTCPGCGSAEVYRRRPRAGTRIVSLFTWLRYLFARGNLQCRACGHTFSAD